MSPERKNPTTEFQKHLNGEAETVNAKLIKSATSVEMLADIIKEFKISIVGSLRTYSPEDLTKVIEGVRDGSVKIGEVTSRDGFRSKLKEFLGKYIKHSEKTLEDEYGEAGPKVDLYKPFGKK